MNNFSIYSNFHSPLNLAGQTFPLDRVHVKDYISTEIKSIESETNSTINFNFTQQLNSVHTFINGMDTSSNTYLWCLPSFTYNLYVNKDTKILSDTIKMITMNAVILLYMNNIHPKSFSSSSIYDRLLGVSFLYITDKYFIKNKSHRSYQQTDVTIYELIQKCAECYMTVVPSSQELINLVWQYNVRNIISIYKIKPGSMNIVTSGPISFTEKAAITLSTETKIRRNKTLEYFKRGLTSRKAAIQYEADTGYKISHMTVSRDYEFFKSGNDKED